MNDALHNKVVKFFYDHEELFIAIMNKTPYQSDGWDYEIEVVKEFLTANQSCYCGDIYNLGVIHRDDGPCHYPNDKEPEQEPNKDGSPCPEFWDWLPKAYNFEGDGNFTKYNMEVAFLAGKQSAQPEQEPVVCPKCKGLGYYNEGHECDDGTMVFGKYVECEKCKQP